MDGNLIALLMNGGALVWGVATMKSESRGMREDINKLADRFEEHTKVTSEALADHGTRLGRVEGRLGINE